MPAAVNQHSSIVFFGAGPVAAASLEFLAGLFDIEAVITKSRPPHHHDSMPVLEWCQQHDVPTRTPATKAELSAEFVKQPYHSALGVVIDYGIIINQDVINTFPLGIANSHFSLLPEWRGADPITFAILSGQRTTGVSLMLINDKMDEGPLLAQATYAIAADETTPSLTDSLIELSNHQLASILPGYLEGSIIPYEQGEDGPVGLKLRASYSRKLTKADSALDWQKPAATLEREVRAFLGWPGSRTTLGDIDVIVTQAHAVSSTVPESAGHIAVLADEGVVMVSTTDGYLRLDRLKPAGKNEMSAAEFLRGYRNRL